MLDKNTEYRIRITDLERFRKRPCTEREKRNEMLVAGYRKKESIGEISKEELMKAILEEDLNDYVHVEFDSYHCPTEFCAVVNKVEDYYTVMAMGERGLLARHQVFCKAEQAYYSLLGYMRWSKKVNSEYNYKPFGKRKADCKPLEERKDDYKPVEEQKADYRPAEERKDRYSAFGRLTSFAKTLRLRLRRR